MVNIFSIRNLTVTRIMIIFFGTFLIEWLSKINVIGIDILIYISTELCFSFGNGENRLYNRDKDNIRMDPKEGSFINLLCLRSFPDIERYSSGLHLSPIYWIGNTCQFS